MGGGQTSEVWRGQEVVFVARMRSRMAVNKAAWRATELCEEGEEPLVEFSEEADEPAKVSCPWSKLICMRTRLRD